MASYFATSHTWETSTADTDMHPWVHCGRPSCRSATRLRESGLLALRQSSDFQGNTITGHYALPDSEDPLPHNWFELSGPDPYGDRRHWAFCSWRCVRLMAHALERGRTGPIAR